MSLSYFRCALNESTLWCIAAFVMGQYMKKEDE